MIDIETYFSFNLNYRGQKFSCSLFLFATFLSCGGASLVMLFKFYVSDTLILTTWSLRLMILSVNGSGELEHLSNLEQYLKLFCISLTVVVQATLFFIVKTSSLI